MTVRHFGTYEFDDAVPELRERGQRVPLQDMPLRVLGLLLQRPGELVSRQEFFGTLWPDDDSGILDDNLNTAVRKLRLALNDSAHHPHYIETIPKRGYRFVAPLHSGQHAGGAAEDANGDAGASPAAPVRAVAVALGLVLAIGAAVVLLRAGGQAPPAFTAAPSTVAVLPFANAGNDPEDRYFSDGLSEEIIDELARAGASKVVSRTSSFAVDADNRDAREIGELLGADALVEGSVRRDGERLRISVRLVDATTGLQLWSERYDRQFEDVFAIQQEIARAIATTLRSTPGEERQTAPQATIDPVAYDHYLRGRYAWHRRSEEGLRTAVRHFRAAVDRAPGYASAWTGLGDAYAVLGFYDYLPPAEAFPMARAAALRALEIVPDNAGAEATLGYVALYYDRDFPTAEAHFLRSIELRPDFSQAHQWYGNLLTAAGRFDEAEAAMRRATQLDPLSLIASAALGWTRYFAGRYDEALAQLALTRELDADFELVYLWSGWVLEAQGRLPDARRMLEEALSRSGGSGIATAALARTLALAGDTERAIAMLEQLAGSDGYVPAYEIGKAWFAAGRPDTAMAWLERALSESSHSLVFLRVDPQLADVRESPPLAAFIGRALD